MPSLIANMNSIKQYKLEKGQHKFYIILNSSSNSGQVELTKRVSIFFELPLAKLKFYSHDFVVAAEQELLTQHPYPYLGLEMNTIKLLSLYAPMEQP